MDIFPADPARVALPRPVACDPMADPIEAAEALDVEMDQVTRLGIFVTYDRFGWSKVFHPGQAGPLENAADGGGGNACLPGNVPTGQALSAKTDDLFDNAFVRLSRAAFGPRRTITHPGGPFLLEALNPARYDLARYGIDAGSLCFGERAAHNSHGHFPSTQRRQSGILMNVHSERSWKLRCGNSSLLNPLRMDNLLKAHI